MCAVSSSLRVETEYHALLTAPRITRLLDRAQANAQGLQDWQVANLREMRRQRDHAIATPVSLISRLTRATSRAEVRWLEARQQGKFELFAPHLEEVVHLVRDKAALLGQALNLAPYDALVDEFSPGITTADIDAMFKGLSRRLPSLIREAISVQESRPPAPLAGKFPASKQRALIVEVMKAGRLPLRPRTSRRERAPLYRRRPRRHPRHHASRSQRPLLRAAGCAARDRPRDVRSWPAAGLARPARRP